MRILEWIDGDRRDSESIGDAAILEALVEDGHRLVRLVPGGASEDPTSEAMPERAALKRLGWRSPSRWSEPSAVRTLCHDLEARGIDAVWARGRGIWSAATAVANRFSVPLWLELGSAEEARAARSIRGLGDFVATVPCPSFATLLHPRIRERLLSCEAREPGAESGRVPLAVPPPLALANLEVARSRSDRAEGGAHEVSPQPPRAMVLLAGNEPIRRAASLDRALAAIARLARDPTTPVELFLEEPLGDRAIVTRSLNSARLAGRAIRLPPLARCRAILGSEAILVATSPLGRLEPSLIEALARGSRFVGVGGSALRGWFVDGREGRLLGLRADSAHWEAAFRDAIALPSQDRPPPGLSRWLHPEARIEAIRSVLRRLEGPLKTRFFTPSSAEPKR